ncbi:hypothetical protein Tco_0762011 [Tanacetum coccineum]
MDYEPMWDADRVVALTPCSAITFPKTPNKFAIKGNHWTLVKGNQFDGRIKTDPHKHIHEFLKIFDMFKYRDTENEAGLLMIDEEPIPQPKPKEPKPDKETLIPKKYKPKIPYPQRLRKEKIIDVINEILAEDFDALLNEGSEIFNFIEGTILKEKLFAELDEFMAMTIDKNYESESNTEEPPFKKITFKTDYKIKTSIEEPPTNLALKPLPNNLEYAFLEEPSFLPIGCFNVAKIHILSLTGKMSLHGKRRNYAWTRGFYRRFIKDFSKIARPLTKFLEKDTPLKFNEECHNAFKLLKEKLTCAPVITIVHTDHSAPRHLFKNQDAKPRLIRWIVLLQEFDIKIKYKKGIENVAADHLSQIENDETSDDNEVAENFPRETLMEIDTRDEP